MLLLQKISTNKHEQLIQSNKYRLISQRNHQIIFVMQFQLFLTDLSLVERVVQSLRKAKNRSDISNDIYVVLFNDMSYVVTSLTFEGILLWDADIVLLNIDRMMDQFKIDQKFTIK